MALREFAPVQINSQRNFPWRLLVSLAFILLATACNQTPLKHPPASEAAHRDWALHFRRLVANTGGSQVWIKHPMRLRRASSPGQTLQVVATPTVYRAVITRLKEDAQANNLELAATESNPSSGHPTANLRIIRGGHDVVRIHLREVPKLLRAAIVIDDMGHDLEAAHKLLALDYPLTFSVLPYQRYTKITAQEAHRDGREVMLHLPMEAEPGPHASPGQGAVMVGMGSAQIEEVLQGDLAEVPYAIGVNNHMGSRATQDAQLMAAVMAILSARHLYFIDSRTTAASKALQAARRQNLPAFYRAVFLDDTQTVDYTLEQLRKFRHSVEQQGVALAIGHPHPTTLAALAEYLPELDRADIELVTPSQIVRLPELARLDPATHPN